MSEAITIECPSCHFPIKVEGSEISHRTYYICKTCKNTVVVKVEVDNA